MSIPFRHSAGFGKRIEYYIIGLMLKEGLDCYVPLVDDDGIDVVIRKENGEFIEVQIKARSKTAIESNVAFFGGLPHELRDNYYFIFYSEAMNTTWIMSSEEFLQEASTNKNGKNKGKHNIQFASTRINKETGKKCAHTNNRFEKYIVKDFSRFYNN